MDFAITLIGVLAASQVMLFVGILFMSKNPSHIKVIGGTLMCAIILYFFVPLISKVTDNVYLIMVFPSLIPLLTLLFVWAVFEEGCRFPPWIIALCVFEVALTVWRGYQDYNMGDFEVVTQVFKIVIAAYAIFIVWRGREHDLVEMRLKIRLIFIGALSITVLGVSISELFHIYEIDLPGRLLANIWMLAISFFGNLSFIKMNPNLILVGDPKELVLIEHANDPVIDDLLARMQDERLYADHDLRVGSLADIVGIPEYQLRQKINQNLGYRNFNQFVNRYRIEEAGQRLIEDSRSPVLSIALDVGFRSISSFNTAFQTQYGVSPTKYRNDALSNS